MPSYFSCHTNNFFNVSSRQKKIDFFSFSVNLENSSYYNIFLCDADNSVLNNLTINGTLFLSHTDNSKFSNLNISGDQFGVYTYYSYKNNFSSINFIKSIFMSLSLNYGNFNILDNISVENSYYGINLKSSNNVLRNFYLNNLTFRGLFLNNAVRNNISNFIINNSSTGISFVYSDYNKLENMSIINYSNSGFYFGSGSNYNLIGFSNISSILSKDLYFQYSTSTDNYFYGNNFRNTSKMQLVTSARNHFNYTYNGFNIGNYWNDLNCLETEDRGGYNVCINPSSYIMSSPNYIDYAPLSYFSMAPPAPLVVEYSSSNPANNSVFTGDSGVTIRVNGSTIMTSVNITLNGVAYPMVDEGSNFWSYLIVKPLNTTNYTYSVSFDGGSLPEMKLTYNVSDVSGGGSIPSGNSSSSNSVMGSIFPATGFISMFLSLFLISLGFIFN